MVFGNIVKGLFGGSQQAPATGPLGLRPGAAIEIETLRFEMMADLLDFELPNDTLFVTASGRADLGDGTILLRYYTENHVMFQVLCSGGVTEADIREVTLYVPHTSIYPEGDEWREWEAPAGRIGQTRFQMGEGPEYHRIWFQEDPDFASPVRFQERVVDNEGGTALISQEVMLFGREIKEGPGFGEYLLVAVEDHDDGRSVELMLGVDLEPGMFRVI